MKKRIITLILVWAFMLTAFSLGVSAQTPLKGIALGDSVAAFFGVDEKDGYVAQLSALLNVNSIENNFTNLAISGLNTQTLLEQLANNAVLAEIKNADIITLNIGGNNILSPFVEILVTDFQTLLTDIAQPSPALLLGLISKKMTEQQMATLVEGVMLFQNDFTEIIKILQTEAPNADIFVNTVYNPITPMLGVYEASEILIPLINKFIQENAEKFGYIVVDIYSVYKESSDNITNFNLITGSVDIHPNAAGHALIAKTAAGKILENIASKPETPVSFETETPLDNSEIAAEIQPDDITQANEPAPPTSDNSLFIGLLIFIAATASAMFIFIRKAYSKMKYRRFI